MTPEETIKLLKQARNILERGWCQRSFAQTADGEQTYFTNPNATKFCISGALRKAIHRESNNNNPLETPLELHELHKIVKKCIPKKFNRSLWAFNDARWRRKKRILKTLDQAINLVKKEAIQ